MGFDLSSVFAGGVAGIFEGVSGIVKDFKADPTEVLKLQQALAIAQIQAQAQFNQAQAAIDQQEAGNNNIFIAGWRPMVGWVCASAMAYKFILLPFAIFIITVAHIQFNTAQLPALDWTEMSTVLFGMLGLGAMRSYEKTNGK